MRRIIKQGLVVALALGTLGSTAWASDKMSRWEGFCYAMQADVNAETIKQAPPPDVTPFQEAQPIEPMTQIFCGIRIVGSDLQYRVRVVADVSNAAGEKVKRIEKVSSCVWG